MRALTLRPAILPAHTWKDDASILRFVSTSTPLSDRSYRPQGLVSLSGAHIDQAGRSSLIRSDIKPHLDALAAEFYQEFHEPLIAISAFRSAEYQQRLWDLGRCDNGAFCAKPGHSEHQLGLALDFFDASSEDAYITNPRYRRFVEWMRENAHHYGWTQSYQH